MGTHISRVKNCLGTYLWHPDEMDAMRSGGNDHASSIYGGPVLDRGFGPVKQCEALPILISKYSEQNKQKLASEVNVTNAERHAGRKPVRGKRSKNLARPACKESCTITEEKAPVAVTATKTVGMDFFEAMLSTPSLEFKLGGKAQNRSAPMTFEEWLSNTDL